MPADIDFDILRELREHAQNMIWHHAGSEDKGRQNAALLAAGLQPIHSEHSLAWDRDQAARYRRFAQTLDAVIAHFGGEQAEAA